MFSTVESEFQPHLQSCFSPIARFVVSASPSSTVSFVPVQLDVDRSRNMSSNVECIDELLCAMSRGKTDFESLVRDSFDNRFPSQVDGSGSSILHYAAVNSDGSTLRWLLHLTGSLDWICHQNSQGLTALMMACAARNTDAVTALLEADGRSCHVNCNSGMGVTALHIAIEEVSWEVAVQLVNAGAELNTRARTRCFDGTLPPLILQCGCTCIELAELNHQNEMVEMLVGVRPAVNGRLFGSKSKFALTPKSHKAIAEALLGEGMTTLETLGNLVRDLEATSTIDDVLEVARVMEANKFACVASDKEMHSEVNRCSPPSCQNIHKTEFKMISKLSLSELLKLIADDGVASGIALMERCIATSTTHQAFPPKFGRLQNDMCISFDVDCEGLSKLAEVKDTNVLGNHVVSRGVFLSSQPQCRNEKFLECMLLTLHDETFQITCFDAPLCLIRSICESNVGSPVCLDEAIAFCCFTEDRMALASIAAVSGLIPFGSLFTTFRTDLLPSILASRVHSQSFARTDLLTLAIQRQSDGFVSFLVSCNGYIVGQHHLVAAARCGTAASFQAIFVARGGRSLLLAEVDKNSGDTPLTAAVSSGTCMNLTGILKIGSQYLQHKNRRGFSPLMIACISGNESAVLQMISLGADLNERTPHGSTPLLAAICGRHDRIVMPLVHGGARLTDSTENSLSPLVAAEYFGSSSVFPLLHAEEKSNCASLTHGDTLLYRSADLVNGLEQYFSKLTKVLPLGCTLCGVRPATFEVPFRAAAIKTSNETVELLKIMIDIITEVSAFVRTTILLPTLFNSDSLIASFLGNFVNELQKAASMSTNMPPGEASAVYLSDQIRQFQRAVYASHRVTGAAQFLETERLAPISNADLWIRASMGDKEAFELRVEVVMEVLMSNSFLIAESENLQRTMTRMLDPLSIGQTSKLDFTALRELLDNFSDDAVSSFEFLLRCREVFLEGFESLGPFLLPRSTTGYVVLTNATGFVVFRNNESVPPGFCKTQYRNAGELLRQEYEILKKM